MPRPVTTLTFAVIGLAALAGGVAAQPQLPERAASPPARPAPPAVAERPWSDVARQLEAQGYRIQELERKREGFEAEVVAADGRRLELRLDAAGRISREVRDD